MIFQKERLIIVALLLVIAYMSLTTCFKKAQQNQVLTKLVETKNDTLQHKKDEAGREHGEKIMAEADIALLKTAYTQQIDSITAILKIKDDQLQSYTGITTTTSGTVRPRIDTIYLDSGRQEYGLNYNDRWLSLKGTIGAKPILNYTLQDSLVITTYTKKTGLFGLGKKEVYIDAFSLNPNMRVTGLTGFRVPVKQPGRWSIGPFIGYGYSGNKWAPTGGFSIQYSLIRF
ncbi:hypothetical protein [Deminuibacter soli]|uniref:Uncharacterized protein n=1 Tax=Deminuibacter soli TaxID=2291815 RepID=A0A3E1NQ40_9BACT|nr:hypothetical protein [Deminuibacter soli]RFM30017.1 hypothetical protein DXN05_03330 [Deminuibacter soli]